MKKIIAALLIGTSLWSCSTDTDAKLAGQLRGINSGIAYFSAYDGDKGFRFDRLLEIKDGEFKWKKTITEPTLYEFKIDTAAKVGVPFFVEEGKAFLNGSIDSLNHMRRGGTPNNDKLQEYLDMDLAYQKQLAEIKKQYAAQYAKVSGTAAGSAIQETMRAEFEKTRLAYEDQVFAWIKTNRQSVAPLYVIERYLRHKRDGKLLSDLYNQMDAQVKRTAYGRTLGELLDKYNMLGEGDFAPNFTGKTPDGQTVSLFQQLGKPLQLIDFWASWCGPCRKANPDVVKLYKEFSPQGFDIISYSLDRPGEEAKWKEAIVTDQLTWTQLSNLMEFDDPAVKAYQIDAIPTTFLIDDRGQILARNLFGKELRDFVANYFAQRAFQNQLLTKKE